MKSLIKSLSIVLISSLISCESNNRTGCLAEYPELYQLEEGFKEELKLFFDLENEPKGVHYKKYIEKVLNYSIPRSFFTDEDKVTTMKSLKESESFKLVWNKFSVIEEQANKSIGSFDEDIVIHTVEGILEEEKEKQDFYTINPNSDIFNCLIENSNNPSAKEMFETIKLIGNLTPSIIGGGLIELNDFDNPTIQTYISLQFYSDYILMINQLGEVED